MHPPNALGGTRDFWDDDTKTSAEPPSWIEQTH